MFSHDLKHRECGTNSATRATRCIGIGGEKETTVAQGPLFVSYIVYYAHSTYMWYDWGKSRG
jgi:hypothetical protein